MYRRAQRNRGHSVLPFVIGVLFGLYSGTLLAEEPNTTPTSAGVSVPVKTGTLKGRVTDADTGKPIGNVKIKVERLAPDPVTGQDTIGYVSSANDGTFRMTDLLPWVYRVSLADAGDYIRVFADDWRKVTIPAGREVSIEYRLKRGAAASIRIQDETGQPLGGAHVVRHRAGANGRLRFPVPRE